ncbi:hypothetical protein GCM10008107_27660 [Psychrosphaera saromensis]|uniref:DUF3192 domain-containing protein n=1 Tax=Psychrosphaera saromensis TaxID=716813 RepID=A0A2S7UXS5_9GAMM|nr:DUF3192 domain-containing protein [Psychrosphaera saromensis]PQJ54071.1 hypothetical protein BTO11_10690 [Psychrosphaera saromensis]GHB76608.1 hypothetical protein GCM10008107_27660 [Psychrosphaera saromensis]GLQ14431.1 hypothetical protein GCM10007917_18860 [Psychrosphaera saromensis]
MNQTFKTLLIALPLTLSLTGCVVVVGNDDDSSTEWKQVQELNKTNITALEVGASLTDIKTKMGTPNINEAFSKNNQQYQVLFYRTRHKHSDGETTKDECTALIFEDGLLTSWGEKAYQKL